MTPVGFEPTQFALVELESTPLDHSGKVSTAGVTKIVVKTSWTVFFLQINENKASPCINPPSPQQSGSQRDADKKADGRRPMKRKKKKQQKKWIINSRRRKQARRGGIAGLAAALSGAGQLCRRHRGPACPSHPAG